MTDRPVPTPTPDTAATLEPTGSPKAQRVAEPAPTAPVRSLRQTIIERLNQVLMFDFFFVLASFVWFAIAVIGRVTDHALGLELWYSLWQPLFQPAIGLLMAGALVSGAIGWLNRRLARTASR